MYTIYTVMAPTLNDQLIANGRALQLDEVVIGAICSEQCTRVLEVLELGLALQRLLARTTRYHLRGRDTARTVIGYEN